MNANRILDELRAERNRIERAISAIEGLNSVATGAAASRAARKGSVFSAATRARMAAAQRARWKARQASTPKPKRHMSKAARRRIAAAQRARWAKVRKEKAAA